MVCSQFIIFEFEQNPIRTVYDKKHSYKGDICYNNTHISKTSNTKFLGLLITDSLSWKDHITQLIPKLSKACYILRCITIYVSGGIEECIPFLLSLPPQLRNNFLGQLLIQFTYFQTSKESSKSYNGIRTKRLLQKTI